MPDVHTFEDLDIWKKSRELTREIYRITDNGLFKADFGLRDQVRRATVSIMSNIAEGFERGGDKEFTRFLFIAKGSCGELRSQLYVAQDCNYIDIDTFRIISEQTLDVSRMIGGFIRYLKKTKQTIVQQ